MAAGIYNSGELLENLTFYLFHGDKSIYLVIGEGVLTADLLELFFVYLAALAEDVDENRNRGECGEEKETISYLS